MDAFRAGFHDPILTLSTLLGFVAVGLWSGRVGGRAQWLAPASAVGAALAGGLLGLIGARIPYSHMAVEAAPLAFGALVAAGLGAPVAVAVAAAAVAGLFQGYATGGANAPDAALYWPGFLLGAAFAACAGVGAHVVVGQAASALALRLLGGLIAAAGLFMLLDII